MATEFYSYLNPALFSQAFKQVSLDKDQKAQAEQFYLVCAKELETDPLLIGSLKSKEVWEGYIRALAHTFSEEEIRATCLRHKITLNPRSKGSLDPIKHILPFVVRILDPIGQQAEDRLSVNAVSSRLREETAAMQEMGLKLLFSLLNPQALEHIKKIDFNLYRDIQRIYYTAYAGDLRKKQYIEILAKKVASFELDPGMIIPSPLKEGGTGYYKVHKKIVKEGLVAYALKPLPGYGSLKPIVLFRPTQTALQAHQSIRAFANNCDVLVGRIGYRAAKEELETLLSDEEFIPEGKRAILAGFSLGGAHAQHLLAEFPEKFERAYFFNDPSLTEEINDKFSQNFSNIPIEQRNLKIRVYRTEGDFVHAAGQVHVGFSQGSIDGLNVKVFKLMPDESEGIDVNAVKRNRMITCFASQRMRLHCKLALQSANTYASFGENLKITTPLKSRLEVARKTEQLRASSLGNDLHINNREEEIRLIEALRLRCAFLLMMLQSFLLAFSNFTNAISSGISYLRSPMGLAWANTSELEALLTAARA